MSYDKTTWASGDVVTSAKLNHIEDGIAGAEPLVLTLATLKWSIISEAVQQGRLCIMYSEAIEDDAEGVVLVYVTSVLHDEVAGKYIVTLAMCNTVATASPLKFAADTPDGPLAPYEG